MDDLLGIPVWMAGLLGGGEKEKDRRVPEGRTAGLHDPFVAEASSTFFSLIRWLQLHGEEHRGWNWAVAVCRGLLASCWVPWRGHLQFFVSWAASSIQQGQALLCICSPDSVLHSVM